ncbi:MAG: hypothetical protein KME31_09070 [Tolypothrix carrinoi HA7290-LM1]|nr:hypothetical protein [Tolypothrix carrinoi HA7290-LM1]
MGIGLAVRSWCRTYARASAVRRANGLAVRSVKRQPRTCRPKGNEN